MFDFKFDWDSTLETGDPLIDAQHKELFSIGREIEQLLLINCVGATDDYLLKLLCKLRDYITYHFYFEEQLLKDISNIDHASHIQSHQDFTSKINSVDCIYLCQNPNQAFLEIKNMLQQWIFDHIVHFDISDLNN